MYAVAYRMLGIRADAEDCVQNAWVSAWQAMPSYRGKAGTHTWLYRIVTNAVLMELRQRKHTVPLDAVSEPTSDDGDPERTATRLTVHRALRALRPEHRAAIVLREFEGLTYNEIAEVLGLSVPTVRNRLHRARAHLAHLLEESR